MVGCGDPEQAERPSAPARSMRIDIASDAQAPAVARSAAKGFCEELNASTRATLVLLVSELVSNAVIHADAPAGAPIVLSIRVEHDRVRVNVGDSGATFAGIGGRAANPGAGAPLDPRERYGLGIVDRASSHWGIDRGAGTNVWFDLAC